MRSAESSQEFNVEEPVYLTSEGLEELKKELEEINKNIPITSKAVEDAKAEGDISENAAYAIAKEQLQELIDKKGEIESDLSRAVVITKEYTADIRLGSSVSLKKEGNDEEEKYTVVGPEEPDLLAGGKISDKSPLGLALLGHKKGDKVEYLAPSGKITYTITDVG